MMEAAAPRLSMHEGCGHTCQAERCWPSRPLPPPPPMWQWAPHHARAVAVHFRQPTQVGRRRPCSAALPGQASSCASKGGLAACCIVSCSRRAMSG